jgi:hypothetical protein
MMVTRPSADFSKLGKLKKLSLLNLFCLFLA